MPHGPSTFDSRLPTDLYGRHESYRKHDAGAYVWLAYSIFFFIEPILRHSAAYWLHQTPIYVVFLGLYVAYVHFESRAVRLMLIAAILGLGVFTIPHNAGGSCFFIYFAALLPFCVESTAILLSAMLVDVAALAIESQIFPGNPFGYLITGFFALVVGLSNLFVAQKKRADARLRGAQEENVALAAVAERERIARDLHDVLGHTLSVIVLKAELASRLLAEGSAHNPVRAAAEIADVERTARTALAEVREAIGGYRAKGIAAEIDQARLTLDAAGVALTCTSPPPALTAREETVLSLALREAVTNIVRHAHATHCRLAFTTTADGYTSLAVEDDGSTRSGDDSKPREGNGLRGMRERVQSLGGRFFIDSSGTSPMGTRLTIELPQDSAAAIAGDPR